MANPQFKRSSIKFGCKGIQISKPPDLLDKGFYLSLKNVRIRREGDIFARDGIADVTPNPAGNTPIHSIRVLNNTVPSASQASALIVGAGPALYTSNSFHDLLTVQDTGYSGDPLSMVPHRPSQSPEPWMYVGDSARMRKVNVGGTDYPIGVAPPNVAPSATIGAPVRKVIQDFDVAGDWTQGGDAGAPAVVADNRVNTTITAILYDSGTTGWALIRPATMTQDIQPGVRLTLGAAAETAVVENVYHQVTDSTIGSITYDSGTSGLCTIQLAAPAPTGLEPNMMLFNSTRSEYIRVLSASTGPDGSVSFRTSTVATFAATDAIVGISSFRIYLTTTRAAADALKATYLSTTLTFATGVGTIDDPNTLDLSTSASNGRPINDDDEIHISVRVDDLTKLTELRVMFDVDSATNDFTKNYYYFPIRANDLTQTVAGTVTTLTSQQILLQREAIMRRINNAHQRQNQRFFDREILNDPLPMFSDPFDPELDPFIPPDLGDTTPPLGQTTTGANQWTEVKFKVKDLQRVGSDDSRTLRHVAKLRVQASITGNLVVHLDSWWIGGTYGPDAGDNPINYRYRYRSSTTGAVSNPSPQMRAPLNPHREQVVLTLQSSSDTQVDFQDIYRSGGTLLDWTYVGSISNGSTTFNDGFLDEEILTNPTLEFDNFQPFPVLDIPRTGTCNVSGTKVTRTAGDTFNTSWAPGSVIFIDGIAYTLYASPTSTSALEIVENAGTKTGVTFSLPSPTIQGQPLPVLFGPYGGGDTGIFMFALGSSHQPGTLFWTKSNNPDSAPEVNQLEITSPSEPLMAGCIYDGRPYVFTTEKMYQINRNFDGTTEFVAQEVANSKGTLTRWGVTVHSKIYFVGKDGIYASEGGQPTSISTALSPLFLADSDSPPANSDDRYGIAPIANLGGFGISKNKLSSSNGFLYFTYQDNSALWRTLIYDIEHGAWIQEETTPMMTCYAPREGFSGAVDTPTYMGGLDGKIYRYLKLASNDDGTNFSCRVLTGFEDMGDPRIQKVFRDFAFDVQAGSRTLTLKTYKDNSLGVAASTTVTTPGPDRTQVIVDLSSGAGFLAKTLAVEITWSNNEVRLFEWHPSWVEKNEVVQRRFTDWTDAGIPGDKRVMGIVIDADTFNVTKNIGIEADSGVHQNINIRHNGQQRKSYAIDPPVITKLLRINADTASGGVPWYLEDLEWITEPYPENLQLTPDFTDDGTLQAKWLQGFDLEADTGGVLVGLQLQGDGGAVIENFVISHNGREVKPYSLVTPFITHTMRLVPDTPYRFFNVKWYWKPESEDTTTWITQPTTFGMEGFLHLRDAYITHRSISNIDFKITVDGVDHTYTIPASGGALVKTYLPLRVSKGKNFQFSLTSASSFRLYKEYSEVRVKRWGENGPYITVNPFGTPQQMGAEI